MSQSNPQARKLRLRKSVFATAMAMSLLAYTPAGYGGQNQDGQGQNGNGSSTASPIKHVIIIVGENRSFDHLYATYVPKNQGEQVSNLLSEGIINADGTPGPNFAKGEQFQIVSPPNGGKFFSSADMAQKTALYHPSGSRFKWRRYAAFYRRLEHPRRRPRYPGSGPVPFRNRWHRVELHRRSGSPYYQR